MMRLRPLLRSLFSVLTLGGAATALADVYINEIFHHPLATASAEWVEIYNPDDIDVDLTGYYLDDGEGLLANFKFPPVTLPGGEYLRVNISGGSDVPNLILGAGLSTGQLANGGDEVALYDAGGSVVHFVRYGSSVEAVPAGATWSGTVALGSPGQALAVTGNNPYDAASWSAQTATPQAPNVAPVAALRVNEVMLDDGEEWIELYYSGANGNLWDYLLTTGATSNYRLPYYPLSGSGYLVLYLDTAAAPVADSVQLGLGANVLNNTSGSMLLTSLFNGSRQASLAWGGSSVAGFSGAVSLAAPYAAGDSLAWLETSGANPNTAGQWINRRAANITLGAANTEQTAPTIAIGTPTPDTDLASCEDVVFPVTLTHSDEAPVRNVTVALDLDALVINGGGTVAYTGHTGGASGTAYNSANNTLTWVLNTVSADVNDLTVSLAASLGVTDYSIPAAALTVAYDRFDNGAPGDNTETAATGVGPYAINAPDISVTVTDFQAPANDFAQSTENGFFDLLVTVTNSGTGEAAAGAVSATINYGTGLRYITVREDTATGTAPASVSNNANTGLLTWDVAALPAGDSQNYYLRFRVRECLDLDLTVETATLCPSTPDGTPETDSATIDLFCELKFTQTVPTDNITACEPFTVRWRVENPNDGVVPLGNATFSFPADFYLLDVLDQNGNSMGLNWGVDYNGSISGGLKTVTLPASLLVPSNVGAEDELPGATASTASATFFDFLLQGNCEPASDEKTFFSINYSLGSQNFSPNLASSGITTDQPSLSVAVVNETDTLATTLTGARGETLDFLLAITNNGDGDLRADTLTSGALATIRSSAAGAGIEVIGVYAGAPSTLPGSPANLIDPASNDFDWNTGAIASGQTQSYTLRVLVIDCANLVVEADVTYSCEGRADIPSDACDLDPGPVDPLRSAKASVELLLNAPVINIVVPNTNISVAYCDDDAATTPGELVTIEIDNNGQGAAASLSLRITGLDLASYDVTDAPGSAFTFDSVDGGDVIFRLTGGTDEDLDGDTDDLGSGETANLLFYLSLKDALVDCTPTDFGFSSIIADYTDLCEIPYETGDGFFAWQLAGDLPSASLTADGTGAGLTNSASTGFWVFAIEHFGDREGAIDYSFVIDYPTGADFDDFVINSVEYESGAVPTVTLTAGVDYTIDAANGTITLNVLSGNGPWLNEAFDASGTYEAVIEVAFTSPPKICGDHVVSAVLDWAGSPTTCKGCPLTDPLVPLDDIDLSYGDNTRSLDLSAASTSLEAGDNNTLTLEVVYAGEPNGTFDYTVTLDMGTDYSVLSVNDAAATAVPYTTPTATTLTFPIAGATFDAAGLYTETFTILTVAPNPQCDDTEITATLAVTDDTSLCDEAPANLTDAVTVAFPNVLGPGSADASLTATASGPGLTQPDAAGTWSFEVEHLGPVGDPLNYTLVLNFPGDGTFTSFEIDALRYSSALVAPAVTLTAGDDYVVDAVNGTITLNVASGSGPWSAEAFDANNAYAALIEVDFTSPANACGDHTVTATLDYAGVPVFRGCTLTDPLTLATPLDLSYNEPPGTFSLSAASNAIGSGDTNTWTAVVTYLGAPGETIDYDLSFAMGTDYTVLSVDGSVVGSVTFPAPVGNVLAFSVAGAAFDADGRYTETFTIETVAPNPQCDDTTIAATLAVTDDTHLCVPNPGNLTSSVTVVFPDGEAAGNPDASLIASASGAGTTLRDEDGIWRFDIEHLGTPGDPITYDFAIAFPGAGDFTNFVIGDVRYSSGAVASTTLIDGVDYVLNLAAGTISLTVAPGFGPWSTEVYDLNGDYEASFEVDFTSPPNICDDHTVTASLTFTGSPTTQNGCTLTNPLTPPTDILLSYNQPLGYLDLTAAELTIERGDANTWTLEVNYTGAPNGSFDYGVLIEMQAAYTIVSIEDQAPTAIPFTLENDDTRLRFEIIGANFDGDGRYREFFTIETVAPITQCEDTRLEATLFVIDDSDLCESDPDPINTSRLIEFEYTDNVGTLDLTAASVLIDPGAANTWTLVVTYTGIPTATFNYKLTIEMGAPYFDLAVEDSTTAAVLFTTPSASSLSFAIADATFDATGVYTETFTIAATAPANQCSSTNLVATLAVTDDTDFCDKTPDDLTASRLIDFNFTGNVGTLTLTPTALSIAPGDLNTWTVAVTYTGLPGFTFDYDLSIEMGAAYDVLAVNDSAPAAVLFTPPSATVLSFSIEDATFDAAGEYTETFTISTQAPDPQCGDTPLAATLTVTDLTNFCEVPAADLIATALVSFPSPPSDGVALEVTPNDVLEAGASGTWTVDFTYIGSANNGLTYELTVDFPDVATDGAGANFTVTSVQRGATTLTAGVDYTNTGSVLAFAPHITTLDAGGEYEETYLIGFATSGSTLGSFATSASVAVTSPPDTDAEGCPPPTAINSAPNATTEVVAPADAIVENTERTVTYLNVNDNGLDLGATVTDRGEDCTTVRLASKFKFQAGSGSSWVNLLYRDTLENGLEVKDDDLANLNLRVYYFSSVGIPSSTSGEVNVGPTEFGGSDLIDLAIVSYNAGIKQLQIDLAGLDGLLAEPNRPNDGGWLWIEYDVVSTASTTPGTFPVTGTILPGNDATANLTIDVSIPALTVERVLGAGDALGFVDHCETVTYRVYLTNSDPWDTYDTRLVIELGNTADAIRDFEYATGSVTFSGLVDGSGNPLTAFEPTLSGPNDQVLTWNLGDLRDVQGNDPYLEFQLTKTCDNTSGNLRATLYSNRHCNDVADASLPGLTAPGDFNDVSTVLVENRLRRGRLVTRWATETLFYTTGYPRLRLDILNVGAGSLSNAQIPIELGDLGNADGLRTLSFVSASVVEIQGTAPGTSTGAINASGATRVVDIDPTEAGTDGDTRILLEIDEIGPASIVTIELVTRMHLNSNLSGHVDGATWGCEFIDGFSPCAAASSFADLNDTINIVPGTTRVEVTSNQARPDLLDFCGDLTTITVRVANTGGVQAYEPIVQAILPEGLELDPMTITYRLNDSGPFIPFTGGAVLSGRATTYAVISGRETLTWNFADPNDDDDESDSPLSGPAFDDPYPADSDGVGLDFFKRGRVLKPGQSIEVRFDASIPEDDCDAALAYDNGTKQALATILFDLPANHDNSVDASFAPAPNRAPLENASLVSNFLEPGGVSIVAALSAANATQSGASTSTRVNGEIGDILDWSFTVESIGDGNVPQLVVEIDVPDEFEVVGGPGGFSVASPANLSIAGTPTADTAGGVTTYTLFFTHSDFDGESYLGADESLEILFSTEVLVCTTEIQAINALARYGCCDGITTTPLVDGASGSDIASTEIKTQPTGVTVTSYEGTSPGADSEDLTACGGMVTLVITNPNANSELPLREMLLRFPLPTGYGYDSSVPTTWSYSGLGARAVGDQLSEGAGEEAEPALSGGQLIWAPDNHPTQPGNIPSAKGFIRPQETVTIQFYLKADGSPYCDSSESFDPWSGSPPGFSTTPIFSWNNGCGTTSPNSISPLSVSPDGADLDITLTPNPSIIDESTNAIDWTVEIANTGNAPAANARFVLDFGDGYTGAYGAPTISVTHTASTTTVVGATEDPDNLGPGGSKAHDLEIDFSGTIAAGQTLTFTITRSVDTSTRGDLSAVAIIRGACTDAVGNPSCDYSYDFAPGRIAGGSLTKVIDENSLNDPGVEVTPHPGITGTFPLASGDQTDAANLTIGSIFREVYRIEVFEGGDTDVTLIVNLPNGLQLLQGNVVNSAGTPTGALNEVDGESTGILNFETSVTGSATGADALFFELWLQVQNLSGITAGANLPVPAEVEFRRVDRTFTKTDIPGLADATDVVVIEPAIGNADVAKTSTPTSLADDHTPSSGAIDTATTTEIDYVVRVANTGTSPAYEVIITDDIPAGLADPTPSLVLTVLDVGLNLDRTLVLNTDYTVDPFTPSTTLGSPVTLMVTLLNTTDGAIQPGETLQLAYTCGFAALAPGAYVDNSAQVASYSSLPGTGADVAIANLGTISEGDDDQERLGAEYTSGLFPKETYHFITGDLTLEKRVRAAFTWFDNNTAPSDLNTDTGVGTTDYTTGAETRATIGEEIRYHVRLKIPPAIQLSQLVFEDTVAAGLTVTEVRWEVVPDGNPFSAGATTFTSYSGDGNETDIVMTHAQANVWGSLVPSTPAAVFTDLLIQIRARVDPTYGSAEAPPVLAGDRIENEASFSWLTFTTTPVTESDTSNTVEFTIREPFVVLSGSRKAITAADQASLGTADYFNFYDEGPIPFATSNPVPGVTVYPTGTTLTYQVRISNTGNTAAYDVVVQDLIPKGMTYDAGSVSIASGATQPVLGGTTALDGTTVNAPSVANPQYAQEIQFTLDILDEGQSLTLEYTATIDTPVVAGRYLQNRVDLWNFTTLPGASAFERFLDRSPSPASGRYLPGPPAYAGVGTPFPVVTQTAETELTDPLLDVTIGELITYTITVDLDEDYLLPDFWLYTELPDGTEKIGLTFNNQFVAQGGGAVTPSESGTTTDRGVEIIFSDDIRGVAAAEDLVITLTALVRQANDTNTLETAESGGVNDDGSIIDALFSDVRLSWNSVDEDPSPSVTFANSYLNNNDPRLSPTYLTDVGPTEVTLTIREPNLNVLTKTQVNTTASRGTTNFWAYTVTPGVPTLFSGVEIVHPLDVITYTVEVTNNGSVPAFDLLLTDVLPPKAFVTFVDRDTSGTIDANDITFSGSAGSTLTATPTPAATDIDSIQFLIDFLLPDATATLVYQIAVDTGIGAGLYIGENEVTLTDYRTLPTADLGVTVGRLTAGDEVYDAEFGSNDRARSILLPAADPHTVRYAIFDDGDDLGVAFPTFTKAGYRLFDQNGDEVDPLTTALVGTDVVRAGEVLRFVLSVTQPPNTVLFNGPGNNALLIEDLLPRGLRLRTGSEVATFGTPATLTGSFATPPTFASQNGNTRHRYRWTFGDVANTNAAEETWTFQFDVDVTGRQTNDTTDLLSLAALYNPGSNNNQARLFWNTIDDPSTVPGRLAERADFSYNANAANSSDKPHLQAASPSARIGQANLSATKQAFAFDGAGSAPAYLGAAYAQNDVIGITGANGDEIVYRLTYTAAGTAATNTGAYDLAVEDRLPERLRPATLTGGADLSAANFVAYIEQSGGGTTVLTPDDDYTLTYDDTTGVFAFEAIYNTVDSAYRAVVDPGDALILAYKVQLDPATGATGGGVGQRVNTVDSGWKSLPAARIDARIAALPLPSAAPSRPRDYVDLDRTFSLQLPSPTVSKAAVSPAAGESLVAGDVVEYRILVPATPIRANMYDVEIIDVLPDGLRFEADGTITGPASVAGVGLDVGATYVAGDEVLVRGGAGNVTITITGRTLTVIIGKIENSDDAGPAFDDLDAFDYDGDQVVITVKATVDPAGQFDSLAPIPRLHEFENIAQFRWYDAPAANPNRVRFAALSETVSHFYNASGILFSPDHVSTVKRGEIIQYRHVLKNFEDEAANVTLTWPASTRDWTWQLYLADAAGNLTSGPFASGHTLNVPAESALDVVMRAFVPTSEARYVTDVLQITATGSENTIIVTDITTVQDEQVTVVKDMSNDNGATFDTRLTVDPDDTQVIIQRLNFVNAGPSDVKNAFLYDFMPEHTEFVLGSATDTADYELQYSKDGGSTWIVAAGNLASEATVTYGATTVVPAVTNLRWRFTANGGVMTPGIVHTIQFSIRVE